MKLLRMCLTFAMVFALFPAPADAALVYTRDGRVFDGTLKVESKGLVLVTPEKRSLLIPYEQIIGISLDGQPLFPAPRRAEESKFLNHDGVIWALVASQVVTALVALVMLVRPVPAAPGPAPAP
jgi:hypothetical protein